jgi:hypothetical protein
VNNLRQKTLDKQKNNKIKVPVTSNGTKDPLGESCMLTRKRILRNTAISLSQYFKALRLCEEFCLKSLISDLSSETLQNYRNGATPKLSI